MRIFVKPAPGKTPRSTVPPYEPIPAEGFVREDGPAWRRLEKAGDVVITKEPAAPRASAAKKEG